MGNFGEPFHWRLAVVEDGAERAGEHLLEADGEHAVGAAERDELARKIERGRARRAVVVDVDDRNTGAADAVDCRLARGRMAVDIARIGLLVMALVEARIGERPVESLLDRKRTRLNSSHYCLSPMPSSSRKKQNTITNI